MSKVFIEESTLTAIGDAIRDKTGGTDLIAPLNMPTEINGISTGSTLPEEAFNITGGCFRRFALNYWNWFINNYGSQVTTNNITGCSDMFYYSDELTTIPFSINCDSTTNFVSCDNVFYGCTQLTALPEITIKPGAMGSMFFGCASLREIPDSYSETFDFSYLNSSSSGGNRFIFVRCYSLRKIPSNFLKKIYNLSTAPYYLIYYDSFENCSSLNEIVGLPVVPAEISNNAFYNTFKGCSRAKNIIFDTNEDGTAKTAQWKEQIIDTNTVGVANGSFFILNYNSGITADKEVTDDTTYAALKNDPDWFTCNSAYSRYNKTSAIATINSLPDTSAYITANGGTNTIKFTGAAGSATDGGAINTMTEEQIAVATAKGWTIAFD